MKKKIILIMVCTCLSGVALIGCGKKTPNNSVSQNTADQNAVIDPEPAAESDTGTLDTTGDVNVDEPSDVMKGYEDVVNKAGSPEEIYAYVDTSMPLATQEEADNMITGLIAYTGVPENLDYARLSSHSEYLSDEMKQYVELMKREQETPSIKKNGESPLSVSELLNRAVDYENLMKDYPNGKTHEYAYMMYQNIMQEAIAGGYDEETKTASRYANDKGVLEEGYYKEYDEFLKGDYKDTKTAGVVRDYVGLYDEARTMGDDIMDYFKNFATKLKEGFLGQGA